MKLFKDRLLSGCGITVIILCCFFLFVSADTGITFQMTFSSFLIILGMSMVISAAALIFKMDTFPYVIRLVFHFVALLGIMLGLLGATGVLAGKSTTQYFLLFVGYTFFYAVISLLIFGLKKLYGYVVSKYFPQAKEDYKRPTGVSTSKKSSAQGQKKKDGGKKSGEKSEYKPLYK